MRLVRLTLLLCVAVFCVCRMSADTGAVLETPYDPTDHWETDVESGLIWRFSGDATPLTYTIIPQLFTVKSPRIGTIRPFHGGDLVLRTRYSLLYEPILAGPEHHFIGASAAGIMEWWDKRRTHALFFSSGGGIGWLDSKGHEVKGGQGEDFNFNWLGYAGVRFLFRNRLSASIGGYFQHISNRNLNSVNPGINAAGPMVSLGWHY
jgi:lipid A 3-O-deacylase